MSVSFSIKGFIRFIKLKLLRKEIVISGSCRMCGACCRKLNLDIGGSWVSSYEKFRELVEKNPDYERFEITGKDRNNLLEFRCTWLKEDGTCKNHDQRLDICREFPDKTMFFMDGQLPKGCGFKAEESIPFNRVLEKQIEKSKSHKN